MIRRPWALVASILAAQFICLAAGVLWYSGWQADAWQHALTEQYVASHQHITAQTVHELAIRMKERAPDSHAASLAELQRLLEELPLPQGWHLSIIDADGALVADRRLRDEPALRNIRLGRWLLQEGDQRKPLAECVAGNNSIVAGQVDTPDGDQLIAAQRIAGSPYVAVVHRPLAPDRSGRTVAGVPLRGAGFAIAVVLVLLTGLLTLRIMNRYENELAVHNRGLRKKVFQRTAALVQTRDAIMFGLARLADSRDRETGAHITRLQSLSALLARAVAKRHPEIDSAWIETLRFASALHDIGKVGIPDAILLKPGPLSAEERLIMQQHAAIGAECLAAIGDRLGENDFLAMAREIALSHHEWWDGSGYPQKLSGEDIPLAARIVAVADVYDAASSTRVYRQAKSHERVRALIIAQSGTQFDPTIVDAFVEVAEQMQRVSAAAEESPGVPPPALNFLRCSDGLPILSGMN